MFNFFQTSPPTKDQNKINSYAGNISPILLSKLPLIMQRNIGSKLDNYLTNDKNKKKVLDVCIQSVKLLKRFVDNLTYVWLVYEDSLELVSCKNDNNNNDVICTFRLNYDNSYGTYHKYQCIDTRDNESAFLAFHFIKGKFYNILPLDARHVLYFAEKVRLGEIPLEVSSSKVIPITDGSKAETGTIESVRCWVPNISHYESLRFSNSFSFSFTVIILNSSTKNERKLSFISAVEHFVNKINNYGPSTFTDTNNIISFVPNNESEIIILNDGDIVKFGKSNPNTSTLWEAALDLDTISSSRLRIIDISNIQNDDNLQRRILLECSICMGLSSIISEYIQGTDVDKDTGAEHYLLDEIVAVQQWAIGSNLPNSVDIGGLNSPQIIDDIQTCSKLSLQEHLELQVGNLLHTYIVPLMLQKNGPGIPSNAARDVHTIVQLKISALLNDIQSLSSLVEALLRRKESQAENFLQETDAETEHDLIVEYISLKLLEIQSLSQVLELFIISCEHPKVSFAYLLIAPEVMFSRESRRVKQDFKIKNWIPEHIGLLGEEMNQSYLFDELVSRLEEPNCQMRIKRIQQLSQYNICITISELLLLPLASIRYSKNLESAKTQLSIAHSIIIHILLDSILSTMDPYVDIEVLNNFAADLGDSANLPKNIQQGIIALWKIDHGIDLDQAVDDLCAPKVNISADVLMFYQITRMLLLSTENKRFTPAKNFLMYFTPFKESLDPVKGIIALTAAMSTPDNWEFGWHTTRRLCTYLDHNSAIEARKQIALLLCKWSLWYRTLVPFLNTVMNAEEQSQIEEYLKFHSNLEIQNMDENAYFVDVTVLWLLRLEKFNEAIELHNRHKESLRASLDRSLIEKREAIIANITRFPSISNRNYNVFRPNDQPTSLEIDMI